MTRAPITAILATTAFGALLGGCATSLETGPGYYHYDVRPVGDPPPVVYRQPAAATAQQPSVVYENPPVVYANPPVVYSEPPTIIYRSGSNTAYHDHGQ